MEPGPIRRNSFLFLDLIPLSLDIEQSRYACRLPSLVGGKESLQWGGRSWFLSARRQASPGNELHSVKGPKWPTESMSSKSNHIHRLRNWLCYFPFKISSKNFVTFYSPGCKKWEASTVERALYSPKPAMTVRFARGNKIWCWKVQLPAFRLLFSLFH